MQNSMPLWQGKDSDGNIVYIVHIARNEGACFLGASYRKEIPKDMEKHTTSWVWYDKNGTSLSGHSTLIDFPKDFHAYIDKKANSLNKDVLLDIVGKVLLKRMILADKGSVSKDEIKTINEIVEKISAL